MLYYSIEESAREMLNRAMKEIDERNYGKALIFLSHATYLDDKDYKGFEMIAQVSLHTPLKTIDSPDPRPSIRCSKSMIELVPSL